MFLLQHTHADLGHSSHSFPQVHGFELVFGAALIPLPSPLHLYRNVILLFLAIGLLCFWFHILICVTEQIKNENFQQTQQIVNCFDNHLCFSLYIDFLHHVHACFAYSSIFAQV